RASKHTTRGISGSMSRWELMHLLELAPSSTGYPGSNQLLGCKFVSRIPPHLQQPLPLLEALRLLSVQNIMMKREQRGASDQLQPLVITQRTSQMGERQLSLLLDYSLYF